MESLLIDHPGGVLKLLGAFFMTVALPLLLIGRLWGRIDNHEERIVKLETGKVDSAVCAGHHDSIGREIRDLKGDVKWIRSVLMKVIERRREDDDAEGEGSV